MESECLSVCRVIVVYYNTVGFSFLHVQPKRSMELRRVLERHKPRLRLPRRLESDLEELRRPVVVVVEDFVESTLEASLLFSSKLHSREGKAVSVEAANSSDISKEKED